jgi:Raf kinase inhibitor-like YbhB/YbcL family protein
MKRSMRLRLAGALAGAVCLSMSLSARAAPPAFALTAKGLHDNASLSRASAASAGDGTGAMCGGENVSPELSFSNAPPGAKSFAVTLFDPDGGSGLGFVHWVVYGIPATVKTLPRGVGAKGPAGSTPGTNQTDGSGYFGPCPPMGDTPHHYIFQAYALDLEPDALKAGLKRDELMEEMRGHVLAYSSVVLRYGRPAARRLR